MNDNIGRVEVPGEGQAAAINQEKEDTLSRVRSLAATGQITRDELVDAFEAAVSPSHDDRLFKRHLNIADILYYIGGAIVFIGIVILVNQNWERLNSFSRILITLGSAVAAYLVGVLLSRDEKFDQVGTPFFLISALLMPTGIMITLYESGVNATSYMMQSVVALICLAVFVATYNLFKRNVFHVFNVIFGTWLFFAFTGYLVGDTAVYDDYNFTMYRFLVVSISFMLLGYYFFKTNRSALTGPLYSFGALGFLGSAMALQGFAPEANAFWEIIYPGLVFGIMFLSVYLKSKSFLTFGAIFLMGYILKITGEYFAEGLGWPASLVIAGLALIAVGYYSVQIKKKYIS